MFVFIVAQTIYLSRHIKTRHDPRIPAWSACAPL
jgi:hypothetical protein